MRPIAKAAVQRAVYTMERRMKECRLEMDNLREQYRNARMDNVLEISNALKEASFECNIYEIGKEALEERLTALKAEAEDCELTAEVLRDKLPDAADLGDFIPPGKQASTTNKKKSVQYICPKCGYKWRYKPVYMCARCGEKVVNKTKN